MARISLTLLFLIMAVVLFFAKTQSYFSDITALKAEKQKYDEALVNSRELQTLRDKLLSQYNAISQDDIGRLNKLLPSTADSGSLIAMVENMVKSRGLLLKKMDVKEVEQAANSSVSLGAPPLPYKTVNLSFSVSGPYASVFSLLGDLEKNLRLIDMSAIGFTASLVDSYEFGISAKTYAVSSSAVANVATAGKEEGEGVQDILNMLTKMRSIKIDSDFFTSDIFKSLVDFTPVLQIPQEYGRPNPFAPVK